MSDTKISRLTDIARLLARHLRRDLVAGAMDDPVLRETETDGGDPERLAADLEAMGPTFVKFGQLLSTRRDLLPAAYCEALARLQDEVSPIDPAVVRSQIADELGHDVDDVFEHFDDEPLASASLAQVHRARLGNGHEVVVKVRRPDIIERIRTDIEVLGRVAETLDSLSEVVHRFAVADLFESFRRSLVAELDLRNEADNLEEMAAALADYDRLVVPRPVHELTASGVLTMDFIDGRAVGSLGELGRLDVDGTVVIDQLLRAYLDQILVHGFVHADPHPGNVLVTEKGLALLDFGMVVRLSHRVRAHLLDMVLALSEGRVDEVVRTSVALGTPLESFDRTAFERSVTSLVGAHQGASTARLEAGTLLLQLTRASAAAGLQPPAELSLVGKALLNLDQIVATLAPTLVPQEVLRDHVGDIVRHELEDGLSPIRAARGAIATARLLEDVPERVHRILGDLADGQLRVRVDALDQDELLRGLEKVATRVAAAVVIAALIVGAALAMRIDSSVTLLGMPAVALTFFVLAGVAALALGAQVVVGDWRDRRRRRRR